MKRDCKARRTASDVPDDSVEQLSRAELDSMLARSASISVAPTAFLMAAAYAALSVSHLLTLPDSASAIMATIAGATSVISLMVWRVNKRTPSATARSHRVLGLLALLILINISVHMALLQDHFQSTHFALVMLGCGFLMLDRVWFALSMLAYLGIWTILFSTLPVSENDGHFGYFMAIASLIALAAHTARRRTTSGAETRRVQSEREIQRARAQTFSVIRENEALLTQILNSIPLAVYLRDHEGRFQLVNRALAELVRKPPMECLDATPGELWGSDHAVMSLFQKDDDVLRGNATRVTSDIHFAGHGQESRHLIRTSNQLIHRGRPAVLTVAVDISQRVKMEEDHQALLIAVQQAQKMESLGVLAAGMAHDFNNSLAAIVNFAEVTAKRVPQDSHEGQYVGHILEAANQAASTTRALMTFSGRQTGKKGSKNIVSMLKKSVTFLKRVLPAPIETSLRVPQDANIFCDMDEVQMQQVLLNLIVNARDAMPDGGQITISLELERSRAGLVLLTIEDNGTGMNQEVKERVFDPFFTTKARGQGTGLGMAIAHGIIDDHHGTIELDSTPGQGTIIKILLPRSFPTDFDQRREEPLELDGHGQTVLLAEDDAIVRSAVVTQLEQTGFAVIEAIDGQAVMDAFADHRDSVRLLLLDVDLPRIDGATCLRRIREQAPEIPAILMSGLPLDKSKQVNASFIHKPFGFLELMSAIRDVLEMPEPISEAVLVIDNDPFVRDSTRALFSSNGVETLLAENERQSVELLRQNVERINAVLLDWNMPDTDPTALLAQLREVSPSIRVFVATGESEADECVIIQGKGFDGVVRKPFADDELIQAVVPKVDDR